MKSSIKDWHLKKGAELRVKSGHPWVFASELANSPTDAAPGSPIRLLDAKGNFVAAGYGNHHSQIAFRGLTWIKDEPFFEDSVLTERITLAFKHRLHLGHQYSARMVFSEGDELPGLILDRYVFENGEQALSFQVLTAGMSRWFENSLPILKTVVNKLKEEGLIKMAWDQTWVISRNDVNIRKLEGMKVEEPKILKPASRVDLSGDELLENQLRKVRVLVNDQSEPQKSLALTVDLIEGQKTGFFLDQSKNMNLVIQALQRRGLNKRTEKVKEPFRVLDLCSYVGHWSLQIGNALKKMGVETELVMADVSAPALALAQENVKALGLKTELVEIDVLKDVEAWPEGPFDLIVVDPPAFVKNRKDLPTGEHAYMKLNTEAFKRSQAGSLIVSCSCSGLVTLETFEAALAKALRRSGRRGVWALSGGQGEDHPVMPHFQEGRYLKMVMTEILDSFTRSK